MGKAISAATDKAIEDCAWLIFSWASVGVRLVCLSSWQKCAGSYIDHGRKLYRASHAIG